MRGFLLDTNHVDAYCRQEASVRQKVRSFPADWLVWICTITRGEIETGHLINETTDQEKRDNFRRLLNEEFLNTEIAISIHTGSYYAKIISGILLKHPRKNSKIKLKEHLFQLGVDINDAWITAVAWEHNLILVTQDQMRCIREAVGSEVQFDCWLPTQF